uniref:Uncharacterized protein n=1 Tax=Parascaris univalens TaxID=6257 RepID=A0A915AV51_PARUN
MSLVRTVYKYYSQFIERFLQIPRNDSAKRNASNEKLFNAESDSATPSRTPLRAWSQSELDVLRGRSIYGTHHCKQHVCRHHTGVEETYALLPPQEGDESLK